MKKIILIVFLCISFAIKSNANLLVINNCEATISKYSYKDSLFALGITIQKEVGNKKIIAFIKFVYDSSFKQINLKKSSRYSNNENLLFEKHWYLYTKQEFDPELTMQYFDSLIIKKKDTSILYVGQVFVETFFLNEGEIKSSDLNALTLNLKQEPIYKDSISNEALIYYAKMLTLSNNSINTLYRSRGKWVLYKRAYPCRDCAYYYSAFLTLNSDYTVISFQSKYCTKRGFVNSRSLQGDIFCYEQIFSFNIKE